MFRYSPSSDKIDFNFPKMQFLLFIFLYMLSQLSMRTLPHVDIYTNENFFTSNLTYCDDLLFLLLLFN